MHSDSVSKPVSKPNDVIQLGGNKQTRRQADSANLGSVVIPALAMTATASSAVANPIPSRKFDALTRVICSKILVEFLDGYEVALTLTCKHFESNRKEMLSYLPQQQCAHGIPSEHDPFRQLIQEARPDRLEQQPLWKQLWRLRNEGSEPLKMTQYISEHPGCGWGRFLDKQGNETTIDICDVCHYRQQPVSYPGRRFEVHFVEEGPQQQRNVLSVYDQRNTKIADIYCPCVFPSTFDHHGWSIGKEGEIIFFNRMGGGNPQLYVWKPDMDTLIARAEAARAEAARKKSTCAVM